MAGLKRAKNYRSFWQRHICSESFAPDGNPSILFTPLAFGKLKLSRTIYPTSCPTLGTPYMPSHAAELPVPKSANQAPFYASRFELLPACSSNICR
jgi:hypothetical protein